MSDETKTSLMPQCPSHWQLPPAPDDDTQALTVIDIIIQTAASLLKMGYNAKFSARLGGAKTQTLFFTNEKERKKRETAVVNRPVHGLSLTSNVNVNDLLNMAHALATHHYVRQSIANFHTVALPFLKQSLTGIEATARPLLRRAFSNVEARAAPFWRIIVPGGQGEENPRPPRPDCPTRSCRSQPPPRPARPPRPPRPERRIPRELWISRPLTRRP